VSHTQLGFESILSLISYRFGLGNLVTRDEMANNIGQGFDWEPATLEPPELPDPTAIASVPCSLGGDTGALSDDLTAPHQRDVDALEDLAVRFGYEIGSGKPEEIFRSPDSVKQAVAAGDELTCEDPNPGPGGPIVYSSGPAPVKRRRKKRRKKKRRKRKN
jgi:hypothetical protein